jgi:hypothetical protein
LGWVGLGWVGLGWVGLGWRVATKWSPTKAGHYLFAAHVRVVQVATSVVVVVDRALVGHVLP